MEVLSFLCIPSWLLLIIVLFITYAFHMSKDYAVFKTMGVPGPKPLPILGNMMPLFKKGLLHAQNDWCKEYGNLFGIFETNIPVLYVSDPEMLKEIFVKQFHNFRNRRIACLGLPFSGVDVVQVLVDNGRPMNQNLTVIKDAQWKHVRNTLSPTFSSGKLKKMNNFINSACGKFVANLMKQAEKKEDIEIKLACGNFTMDVIASTLFSMQVDSQVMRDDPFVVHGKTLFTFPSWVVILAVFIPSVLTLMVKLNSPSPYKEAIAFYQDTIDKLLRERKGDSEKRHDFLQLMVDAEELAEDTTEEVNIIPGTQKDNDSPKRKGLTSDEILGQSVLFFLAGFETVAFTLSMVFYSLALHPDELKKTLLEIDKVLGKEENVTYEQAGELHYLEQVISESQRLYPAAVRIDRICSETTTIKGITIPKGMIVAAPVHAIHRNKEFWSDAERFYPERFSADVRADINPLTFMPFGHGPRNCIAMRLAMLEVKMAVARVLQKLRPVKVSRTKEDPKFSKTVFLKIVGGTWIGMEKRE